MAATEEPNPGYEAGTVKKLRLEDGLQVGIKNLDAILKEVAGLGLPDTRSLKRELFERVKAENYVPSGAEREYAAALLRAYREKFEDAATAGDSSRKKTSGG